MDAEPSLTAASIKAKALDVGFDLCGISPASRHPKLARLASWIAEGRAGEMRYLADSLDERSDPSVFLPTAKSVISLAVVYNTNHPYSTDATAEPGRVAIARYAWGDDYHDVLRRRLRELVTWMADSAGPGLEALTCVDDGPVQERVFAEQAGIGWIGKNTCVINATLGSWLFLAEVVTNAAVDPDTPAIDQCGTCTRCIDACPTGAIVEPYLVDATKCLSYLTIEQRGDVDASLQPAIREQVYGCDICQDVCPWNRRAATSHDPAWQPRPALLYPRLGDLCQMTDDAWRPLMKGSAMRRAGLPRLKRSLAYAAANLAGDAATTAALSCDAALRKGLPVADRTGRTVVYRYLNPSDDIEAITEMLHEAYAPLAATGMKFVASHQDSSVTRRRMAKGKTIVAVDSNMLVGIVTLGRAGAGEGPPIYREADVASFDQFAVRPSCQRRGIGSMLLSLVAQRALDLGVGRLALDTAEHATALIAFYGSRGFCHVNFWRWETVNYRSVVMAKPLGRAG